MLARIRIFYRHKKRIPLKREMYGIYGEAREIFGNWNRAIEAAGFKPNPVLFADKHIANDGHHCDSLAEKIIDDWLDSQGIEHKRNICRKYKLPLIAIYPKDLFPKNRLSEILRTP